MHGIFFFRRFWEKFRVRKGILGLYCYALHKNTVTWFIIVLRWTICAKKNIFYFFCVRMCYNNTLKNFIVNFFLFLEYDFIMGLKWISCALQILGKLIQFCRIKLNWVILTTAFWEIKSVWFNVTISFQNFFDFGGENSSFLSFPLRVEKRWKWNNENNVKVWNNKEKFLLFCSFICLKLFLFRLIQFLNERY